MIFNRAIAMNLRYLLHSQKICDKCRKTNLWTYVMKFMTGLIKNNYFMWLYFSDKTKHFEFYVQSYNAVIFDIAIEINLWYLLNSLKICDNVKNVSVNKWKKTYGRIN